MTRKGRVRLALGVALLMLAGAAIYRVTVSGGFAPHGFDAAHWQAQRGSEARDNPRAGMVGDLERLLRPGMTRAEVEALLGMPESQHEGRWIYDLGASPYGIDYEYYVIEFDDAGRLARHQFMRG